MTHQERLQIFEKVETGCVTDAMLLYRIGAWTSGIFPVDVEARIYGRAVTAQYDMVANAENIVTPYEMIEMCEPGDVLVWNAASKYQVMGGNIYNFMRRNGLAGVVLEGHVRDIGEIRQAGGTVFCQGPAIGTPATNFRASKQSVNIPVTVGGAVVRPGDYLFGDADGVMVIPFEDVDDVLQQALYNMEWEAELAKAIQAGYNAQQMKAVYAQQKVHPRTRKGESQ